jgi:hypothetical protein
MEKAPPYKPHGIILKKDNPSNTYVSLKILIYIPSKPKNDAWTRTGNQIHIIA